MMQALKLLQLAKRHVSGRSNVEQRRNQAHSLSCYRACLKASASQIVSQKKNLVTKKILQSHSNLMQKFRVDLKTFLGLANAAMLSQGKCLAGL